MKGLADLLYPNKCVGCSRPVNGAFCRVCFEAVPRIGSDVCARCGRPGVGRRRCPDCGGRELHFDLARQAAEFDPVVRRVIHRFKYSGSRRLQVLLAALIAELAEEIDISATVVTWIPVSKRRLQSTGMDHGRMLAELVARGLQLESMPLITRTGERPAQMRLSPEARRTNLIGAFAAVAVPPDRVTVVDDVYTTGSTASEAARALKEAGASHVQVLCAARSFENI